MIKYILLGLSLGLVGTVSIIQHDAWLCLKINDHITAVFEKNFASNAQLTINRYSLLFPRLEISDISVSPQTNTDWSWKADRAQFSFSWWHLLTTGALDVQITVDNWHLQTEIVDNEIKIKAHLEELFRNSSFPVPIIITGVHLNKTSIAAHTRDKSISCSASFSTRAQRNKNHFHATSYILHGSLRHNEINTLTDFSGTIQTEIDTQTDNLHMQFINSCTIPSLEQEQCYLKGSWDGKYGRFSLSTAHNTFFVDPIIIGQHGGKITGQLPIKLAYALVPEYVHLSEASGSCLISLSFSNPPHPVIQGQLLFQDVMYARHGLCDTAKISFHINNNDYNGKILIRACNSELSGNYSGNLLKSTGKLSLQNQTLFQFPGAYWQILPHKGIFELSLQDMQLLPSCAIQVTDVFSNTQKKIHMQSSYVDKKLVIDAKMEGLQLQYSGDFASLHKKHSLMWEKNSQAIAAIFLSHNTQEDNMSIQGTMDFEALQSLIYAWSGYQIQGTGLFTLLGTMRDELTSLDIELQNGNVRLPETYNFINTFSSSLLFDIEKRTCNVSNTSCGLHAGTLHIDQARISFDEYWKCSFAHIPIALEQCIINIEKDLFASMSGAFTLFKTPHNPLPCIKGTLFIDHAQIKKDIDTNFLRKLKNKSPISQINPYILPFLCDLKVQTINPIQIMIPQLETDVHIRLHAKDLIYKPDITGTISCVGGTIYFPYKPLYISRGKLLFTSGNHLDPTIELIAKNSIKNYNITMHIAGTALAHHIMVDATPLLSQEQIIALLLFGSPHESLHALIPALITDNFTGLFFGEHQSQLINVYVQRLFKPLSVNLIPSFTDQSGRGGLRVALEIDINDRLRGLIQKNFSLTEDTRFELEYQLSDDILIRGIRDERRDIAGEVEMRWKF